MGSTLLPPADWRYSLRASLHGSQVYVIIAPAHAPFQRKRWIMELFDLKGKVALVTGGNGGIGLGIARGLAGAGADVAVAGRNREKNVAAVAELAGLGVRAIELVVDVTDETQVNRMVEATIQKLGGLDILVANAGTNVRKSPETYSLEEWH